MVLRTATIAGLFATALAAQGSLVLPSSHAGREGTGSTNLPFGRSGTVRMQAAYSGSLFAGAATLRRIAFRLDGGASAAGKQVEFEVRMSTMPQPIELLANDFSRNRGSDEAVVLPRAVRSLPAQPAAGSPSPFHLQFDLATPFAYDPVQGPLLVEVVVFGGAPGAYPLDATFVCQSPQSAFGPAPCPASSGRPLRVESATTQVLWGRPWVLRVLDAPPGALTALVLGTRESGAWNGWILPFDLAPLGAAGCFLSTDVAASYQQVAAADGSASFALQIPPRAALVGLWLRFQAGAVDLPANALGVVTSQAQKVQICGWEPVGRVHHTDLAASAGLLETGVAPVLQIGF